MNMHTSVSMETHLFLGRQKLEQLLYHLLSHLLSVHREHHVSYIVVVHSKCAQHDGYMKRVCVERTSSPTHK